MEAAESLFKCLEQVADPRKARGVRHPFQAILRLTLLGLVCGQTTMAHIALFARMHWPVLKEPLGFLRDLRPSQGGGPPPRLHWCAGLSPAAGRGRRHRRRADGPAAGGPRQHRTRRRPLPAGNGGPGALRRARGQLTLRADSGFYTHAVVAACRETKVRFSITIRQHNLIEAIPEADWTPVPYWMDGAADVAETTCTPFQSEPDATPVRLIVRRVKPTPGSQLALFATAAITASSQAGTGRPLTGVGIFVPCL